MAPGFIDIQGQSTEPLLIGDGRVISKVTQGVTTEILGEGSTPAPVNDKMLAMLDASDTSDIRISKSEAQGVPSAAQLDTMRRVTRDAMKDGAFGWRAVKQGVRRCEAGV
ncbi:MAG: hypothetical protein ABI664_17170 [bacterium]